MNRTLVILALTLSVIGLSASASYASSVTVNSQIVNLSSASSHTGIRLSGARFHRISNDLAADIYAAAPAATASSLGGANSGFDPVGALSADDDRRFSPVGPLACPDGPCGPRTLPDFTSRRTVPEPATLSLIGLGIGAIAIARRRRRSPND